LTPPRYQDLLSLQDLKMERPFPFTIPERHFNMTNPDLLLQQIHDS
jgi:hypothetical protein